VVALCLLALLYHMVRLWRINPLEAIKNE
jgi:hypothetical protein